MRKQGRRAYKTGGPTRQAGLQGRRAYMAGGPTRQSCLQGRRAYKAGRPTRQAGLQGRQAGLNDLLALTANMFVAATNITNINSKTGNTCN
jgi:hypothetical protein